MVLRNGEPRYIFPALDTYIETADGMAWRNRGLNTVPLAKTWLHYGESPADSLRLSAYISSCPDAPAEQIFGHRPVAAALDAACESLENLPPLLKRSSLGDGFCFLLCPLPDLPESEQFLPARALAPGTRLRVFLSDIEKDILLPNTEQGTAIWQRGDLDMTMWQIPSGRESPYLPEPYAPLYNHPW